MINLLPDETKRQLHAAHTNVTLFKYLAILGVAIAFLSLACTVSYLFLVNNKTADISSVGDSQSTKSIYTIAQKQLNTIVSGLLTAKSILSQQIQYSNVITGIAATLPPGIILSKLTLNNNTISKPIILQANARSADNVPLIKNNFSKSPLFSNYNLQSVTPNIDATSSFPIQIIFSITINKGVAQ